MPHHSLFRTTLALILALAGLSFNLAEAAAPAPLARTGQTPTTPFNPAPLGADGALHRGVVWPSPRFIDNADGTITDSLTNLVWLKNANCTDTVGGVKKVKKIIGVKPGTLPWSQALAWSNALATGNCGLSDGSAAGDWRLPNRKELDSLVDLGQARPALPDSHPFQNVLLTRNYWSSSTDATLSTQAWNLNLANGDTGRGGKMGSFFVWPVRDTPPKIGDTYQGGIVFYIDGSGRHGLIAAPQDQSPRIAWWNGSYIDVGVRDGAVGAGQANTDKIIAAQGAGNYAASLAANLVLNDYSDWFLPSSGELYQMYTSIGPGAPPPLTNIGGFSNSTKEFSGYWSSSEDWSKEAFVQFFDPFAQNYLDKSWQLLVRAVRAF